MKRNTTPAPAKAAPAAQGAPQGASLREVG
jgi:hypothetical protein